MLPYIIHTHVFVHCTRIIPMYNKHPYFSLKNLGKKVHIIHGKIQYAVRKGFFVHLACSWHSSPIKTISLLRIGLAMIYCVLNFLEGKGGRKREGNIDVQEKHQLVASHTPPAGTQPATQAHADWESNWQPFGLQAGIQSTEPHWLGLCFFCCCFFKIYLYGEQMVMGKTQ